MWLIGEDSLTALDWLANFNHDAGDADVKDGLENGINFSINSVAYNDGIIYPLIAHSQQYVYDATSNTGSGLNISTASQHHNQRGVLPEDLKPAILIKTLLKLLKKNIH